MTINNQNQVENYSKEEQEDISQRLNMRLGPEYVSYRQGAGGSTSYYMTTRQSSMLTLGRVPYLEGNKAVELANKILGFNGWSMSVQDFTLDYCDENNGRFNIGISSIVRVTLKDGSFREDVGYGTMVNGRSKGECFEKAKKEAVTDAMKRCLRLFGNAIGNCIYDKSYLQTLQKCSSNAKQTYAEADMLRPTTDFDRKSPILFNPKTMENTSKQFVHVPPTKQHNNQTTKNNTPEIPFDDDMDDSFFDDVSTSLSSIKRPPPSTSNAYHKRPHQQ